MAYTYVYIAMYRGVPDGEDVIVDLIVSTLDVCINVSTLDVGIIMSTLDVGTTNFKVHIRTLK